MRRRPLQAGTRAGRGARLLAGACVLLSGACGSTQRVSGPLYGPEPAAQERPPSSLEALVVRHAGPVWVFRPGATEGYTVPFFRKRERVRAGGGVRVGWGGRAEILWPGTASSAVLFEEGQAYLGDPARDEPLMELRHVTRVKLMLTPADRIVLPGGAVLHGDESASSGPFLIESLEPDLYRATNQSKQRASILFRDAVLEIAPGDDVVLPLLGVGSEPEDVDPDQAQLSAGGIDFGVIGRVAPADHGTGGVRLEAQEPVSLAARGVLVRLEAGQAASFSGLGETPTVTAGDGGTR